MKIIQNYFKLSLFSAAFMTIANRADSAKLYQLNEDTGQFEEVWMGPKLRNLHPLVVQQESATLTMLLEARPLNLSQPLGVNVYILVNQEKGDFIERFVLIDVTEWYSLFKLNYSFVKL